MPQFPNIAFQLANVPGLLMLFHIVVMVVVAFLVLKLIDSALKRLRLLIPPGDAVRIHRAEQRAETLRHIIRSVVKFALIVFVGLTISSELGFNVGPLLASVGIAGVAIGFGAQTLVKDVIAGFFILLEDQYGVGDVIKIGNNSGVVERMSLRVTVLRNVEGQVHVIPNGSIPSVTVLTKEWARAVVDVKVGYREDLDHVFRVLEQTGDLLHEDWPDRVTEKPTILGIERLAGDGITIRCIVKTLPMKQWDVMREWRRRIKEAFDREGILLQQTPARTVLVEPEPEKKSLGMGDH